MSFLFSGWRILADATDQETAPMLAQNPVWHCFALADLYPPWRAYSQFALALQDARNEAACCLIVRHPIIGQVLSPSGNDEGIAALLHTLTLPEHPLVQVQERHLSLLQQVYQPVTNWRKMYRMAVAATSWHAPSSMTPQPVTRLTLADLPALHHLYQQHPESSFILYRREVAPFEELTYQDTEPNLDLIHPGSVFGSVQRSSLGAFCRCSQF